MSSANNDTFASSFLFWIPFISFSYLLRTGLLILCWIKVVSMVNLRKCFQLFYCWAWYYLWVYHVCVCAKFLQSCPALCSPKGHSPPGSSVHGILQARILEWVAILSPKGLPRPGIKAKPPRLLHWQPGSSPLVLLGEPWAYRIWPLLCWGRFPL